MIDNSITNTVESRLEQHEEFLNDYFSLLKVDVNGIIQYANPSFCELSKYTPEELIGQPFEYILSPDSRSEILEQTLNLVKSHNNWTTIVENKDKNGETHWLKIYITPFHNQNGEVEEIYLVMTEVTKYMEATSKTQTQAALYEIIEITNKKLKTKEMLRECLDVLLNLSWFKVEGKGGFMLKQEGQDSLKMTAHKGLGHELLKMCDVVEFGRCLCGIAAQKKKFIHSSCIDHRHHNRPEGMTPHGHYNIPILWSNKVIGVLFLYLEDGYTKKQTDEDFLKIVSETIAGALYRKRIQKSREEYLKKQQSQAVLYQIIEVSNKPTEEKELLADCLKVLLNVEWLKVENKGAAFIKDLKKDELKLVAHRNLGLNLLKMCNVVPFGQCLCGMAAQKQELIHASCVDDRHHNRPEGMEPHGHYNIPILWRNEVFAVIVLYLEHGHKKTDFEATFLKNVADTISAAIFRKRTRRMRDKQTERIEQLNQKLVSSQKELKDQNSELNSLNENVKKSHDLLEVQTNKLDKKQNNILASITYAKRIQVALLPIKSNFPILFDDSFIFDKPREIVGGDFLWFMQKKNVTFVIVADCTGHGVPGAFMTVIANNVIDDIIKERGYIIPNQILDSLDRGIKKALHQDKTKNNDGMDLSLTVIDKVNRQVYFSGAKSPLVYLNKKGELNEIKGTRRHIGGSQMVRKQKEFEMKIIDLEENTWFYMFSDGYRDQFGQDNRKFGKQRFMDLLQSLHGLTGEEQNKRLDSVLSSWSGNERQIDDILCVGFKV